MAKSAPVRSAERTSGISRVSPAPHVRTGIENVGACYWRRLGGDRVLLTNDSGLYVVFSEAEFERFLNNRIQEGSQTWDLLCSEGFVRDRMDFEAMAADFRKLNMSLWSGPTLHIIVVTLRCDHRCVYCQSGVVGPAGRETDMTPETARPVVDRIFESPSPDIIIEFQGGEPLLNWPVVKFVIEYAKKKNEIAKKNLRISIVSNFSFMDMERFDYLLENEVSLCTSLDGPEKLHNRHRISTGNPHRQALKWIGEIQKRLKESKPPRKKIFLPNALMTTTRFSFPHFKEIVDEYVRLGMEGIFIRPLSPIGYAKRVWDKIGYEPQEYVGFYRRSLDYILQVNRGGYELMERTAVILTSKILRQEDPGFLDLRSPCGGGTGQIAYNYNGDVYTCDEGRMLGQEGNHLFRIGNVFKDSYDGTVDNPVTRTCALASCCEVQPLCSTCAYKPYCGTCPVLNFETQGSVWGLLPSNFHCATVKGVFDHIFRKLDNPQTVEIFQSWLRKRKAWSGHEENEKQQK